MRVDDFQGKKYGESNDVENLLVERLGGGVARLNDYRAGVARLNDCRKGGCI